MYVEMNKTKKKKHMKLHKYIFFKLKQNELRSTTEHTRAIYRFGAVIRPGG